MPINDTYLEAIVATQKTSLFITLERFDSLERTHSKVGGFPYLPLDIPYPTGKNGQILDFLAQINFEETPPMEGFPPSGILQFYIATDDMMGLDLDNPLNGDVHVLYHPDSTLPPQTHFESLIDLRNEQNYHSPLTPHSAFKMLFTPTTQAISLRDFRFETLLAPIEDETLYEVYEQQFPSTGHRIGGYPFFTQDDPRGYHPKLQEYTTLLFQLDTDNAHEIMWGDAGVGNVFITPEALVALDFSKVLFNWDCH